MSAPIVISSLPSLSPILDSDLMLVRRGGGDYQTTAALVRTINIGGLPALASLSTGIAQPSDQMMIARAGSSYQLPFNQVGFIQGTAMWFYLDVANRPSGWTIAPGLTDCLLAVQGGSVFTSGATSLGTWQQADCTLNADQINHQHYAFTATNRGVLNSGNGSEFFSAYKVNQPPLITGDLLSPDSVVSTQPHNHGNSWRPYAAVGNIYTKDN